MLDALNDLFGSLPGEEAPPVIAQDVRSQPVVRIAFTGTEVMLGKRGRRKKVAAGVGLLFPELMGLGGPEHQNCGRGFGYTT